MSAEWEKLGDNIQAKEQYLLKNRTAFEHLGVSIGKVTDAENLFNQGKEAFVASVMARARASAAMTLATEKYNEAIRKQLEVDRMADTQSYAIQGGQFGQTTYVSGENLSKKKAQAEADSLFDEARKVLERGLEYSEEERKSLETANLKTIHTLEQGIEYAQYRCAYSIPALSAQPTSVVRMILPQRCHFCGRALESVSPSGKKRNTFISIAR